MFDYEVKHLKGTNNVEADMLSRHPIAQYIQHSVHLLELNEKKTHQNLDNVNDPKYKKVDDVFVLKKKNLFKIVVPFSLRRKILQNAHEQFGHPSTQKTIKLITPQYYWPHINLDISKFVKHCNATPTYTQPQCTGYGKDGWNKTSLRGADVARGTPASVYQRIHCQEVVTPQTSSDIWQYKQVTLNAPIPTTIITQIIGSQYATLMASIKKTAFDLTPQMTAFEKPFLLTLCT
ncbi:transposon Ty3-I Gag-Pol polyprotein [Trichonephila clavipes]|nr:transposon Ty3-I Gag-Pol polyprotein [Trichonephila clavipes]